MNQILNDEKFDVNQQLILIIKQKTGDKIQYSTPFTLMELEYDVSDVVERIKELSVRDYSETLFDTNDESPPLLMVFGKKINQKTVYIKLKIKKLEQKKILCLSFHYAEKPMSFPYA